MSSTRMAVAVAGARKGFAAAGAAAAAAAGAAAGGAAAEPAESRAAPPTDQAVDEVLTLSTISSHGDVSHALTHDNLKAAADAMIQSGELLQTFSEDGTAWVDVARDILEEATELAAREDMQRIIMESAERRRNRGLTLRLLEAQQSDRSATQSLASGAAESTFSLVEEGGEDAPPPLPPSSCCPSSSASLSAGWSTPSLNEVLAAENEALRIENAELLRENRSLGGRVDAATRLQKAARARLERTRWYERGSVVRELRKPAPPSLPAPTETTPPPTTSTTPHTTTTPTVRVVVGAAAPGSPGAVRVRLTVLAAESAPSSASPPRASSVPRAVPLAYSDSYDAIIVALSIVVGVLAVVMTRNPRAATKAAVGAAATVKAMCAAMLRR